MKRLLSALLALVMLALPLSASAAITFLEPSGDADFLVGTTNGFWAAVTNAPAVATDFVHGGHQRSIKYRPGVGDIVKTASGTISDTGARISVYVYFNAMPSSAGGVTIFDLRKTGGLGADDIVSVNITPSGTLQMWQNGNTFQIGGNATLGNLATGVWYRISLAYTITSTSVNRFELRVNGISTISITNATITSTGSSRVAIGNLNTDTALDMRTSDHYIDNSSALTDTGDIWVTAKRPNANGTTNGFTTQIGSGGSGYGTGHSPQVNERPLSTTNGWSMVGAGSAITEEYNIENAATGDISLTGATIVGYEGWISAKSLVGEPAKLVLSGTNVPRTLTTSIATYFATTTSATYPAGTGTDIGLTTDTSLTTVSLYEAGIVVAYIPAATVAQNYWFWVWWW